LVRLILEFPEHACLGPWLAELTLSSEMSTFLELNPDLLSRILGNDFYGDDYLISISRYRTIWESCCLGLMAANSPWVGTDQKAHDSLNGPVRVELFPISLKSFSNNTYVRVSAKSNLSNCEFYFHMMW